jgi:hypothetical protein
MARARPAFLKLILSAAFLAGMLWLPSVALAEPGSLRDKMFGPRQADGLLVARYVSEDGQSFVFDRSQRPPLIKFDNSPEVWALSSKQAPRGDVIYRNDVGKAILRSTRLGGVTLFTDLQPSGSAVSPQGAAAPLRLPAMTTQQMTERVLQASARASRAAKHLIQFEASASPETAPLIADTAIVTAEAVVRISRRREGSAMLTQVSKVTVIEGRKVGVVVRQRDLQITVVTRDGFAGRPSSDKIVAAASK